MLIDTLKWREWHKDLGKMAYSAWPPPHWAGHHYMATTGLLDANGKEIWEGDIVFFPIFEWEEEKFYYRDVCYGLRGAIEYRHEEDRTQHKHELCIVDINHEPICCPYIREFHQEHRIVVGNIHENPRVLSAKICPECHILAPHKHIYHGLCEWCTAEYGPDVDQKFTVVKSKSGDNTIKLRGIEIIVTVVDEYAVTPPAKPKTIEAFKLPDADNWETDTFEKWARKLGLIPGEEISKDEVSRGERYWGDWSGPYSGKNIRIFVEGIARLHLYAGQWVIKEGDTWRVADRWDKE